jgi:aminopeptidase N
MSSFFAKAQWNTECIAKSEMMAFKDLRLFKKSLLTESYNNLHQKIELDIHLDQRWVKGKITTTFQTLKPAFNIIQFDLVNNLTVDSVVYHGKSLAFTHTNDALTAQITNGLPVGAIDSVSVYYQGNPGVNNPYQSFVFDAHNAKKPVPIAWTLSQPYGSKAWWPCKESLTDKIDSSDIIVTVIKGNMAASNGVLVRRQIINDSQETFHWKHRYPIATYLVAVAVTNYVEYEDYVVYPNNDTLSILNYVYPEYDSVARTKSPETVRMMRLLDSLFIEYPFKKEKYGHAQWGWGGGMEHQTMSFMVHLNFDLVAHELAHQWFGDYATCGSWADIWLNEGFATYVNGLCREHLINRGVFRDFLRETRDDVTKEPNGSVFISDTSSRSRLFSGRLTYSKAAFILHMLRWKLGDQAFFAGIRNYLQLPQTVYGTTKTADLKRELEKISGQNLTEFFNDWFYGEGHPIYDISWSHIGNHLTMRIQQKQSHPSVSFFNIKLPFVIKGKNNDTTLILDPLSKDNTFEVDLDFIPTHVDFDPEVWVLCKSTVLKVKSQNSPEIHVFPIPAEDYLTLYDYRGTIQAVRVYDMAGRKTMDIDYKAIGMISDKQELDIRNYSAGLYTLEVTTDLGIARQRFLKR